MVRKYFSERIQNYFLNLLKITTNTTTVKSCHSINFQSFGRKTINPISAAAQAQINTAPAPMSFAFPALSLYPGETRSVRNSMAVLNNSAANTMAMATISHIHSETVSRRIIASDSTITVATVCIRAFLCVFSMNPIPFNANLKLAVRRCLLLGDFIISALDQP